MPIAAQDFIRRDDVTLNKLFPFSSCSFFSLDDLELC